MEKQRIAAELKEELKNPDNDVRTTIQKYQGENTSAVSQEFWGSYPFAKRYVTTEKNKNLAYDKGEFGKILDTALTKLKQ